MAKSKTIEKTAEKCIKTLEFIKDFLDKNGYPPTVREICNNVGFKSTASAQYYLGKLEEQGEIRKGDNKNRAIEIVNKTSTNSVIDNNISVVSEIAENNIVNSKEVFSNLVTIPNIVLDDFYHFLQAALSDMKFIICPFPVDTTEQKIYWGKRYNRTNIAISQETDPRRKHQLMTQLKYIHQTQRRNMLVENQLISEDFFLLLFGKTKTILRNNRNAAMNWGGSALFLEPLSKKRKEEVLTRINNLNTQR